MVVYFIILYPFISRTSLPFTSILGMQNAEEHPTCRGCVEPFQSHVQNFFPAINAIPSATQTISYPNDQLPNNPEINPQVHHCFFSSLC